MQYSHYTYAVIFLICLQVNFAHKVYLDLLCRCGTDDAVSSLQSGLFYKDTAGFMDNVAGQGTLNTGLRTRMAFTNGGKILQLEGPIWHDLCDTPNPRLLINGVSIDLKYHLARSRFSLMSAEKKEYRVEVGVSLML